MRVNVREVFALSGSNGISRPIYFYNESNFDISDIEIFFYSQNKETYDRLLTPPSNMNFTFSVIIEGYSFPIKKNFPGESPFNPIKFKSTDLYLKKYSKLELSYVSSHGPINTIYSWGSSNFGGSGENEGWGGISPDENFFNDLICVVQPVLADNIIY